MPFAPRATPLTRFPMPDAHEAPRDGDDQDDEALASVIAAALADMDALLQTSTTTSTTPSKQRRRAQRTAIERQSRRRRQQRLTDLRDETRTLEQRLTWAIDHHDHEDPKGGPNRSNRSPTSSCALIDSLHDALDARHDRIDGLRRQFRELLLTTKRLEDESHELRDRLRRSHRQFAQIQGLLEHVPQPENPIDLSIATFEPLPLDEALGVIRESLRRCAHLETHGHQSSGMQLHGWRDRYCLRDEFLCIGLTKRFLGRDAEQLMLKTWDLFSSLENICKELGKPGHTSLARLLQALTDDIRIIHLYAFVHDTSKVLHVVFLVYRVQVDDGFVVGFRNIPVPGFKCLLRPGDELTTVNNWLRFVRVRDEDGRVIGCDVTDGGKIEQTKAKSVPKMLCACLESVLLWERFCAVSTLLPAP